MIAIFSILLSLIYLFITNLYEIQYPSYDKTLSWVNLAGLPYFFGTAMFMFEGNTVSIEIYHQMENNGRNYGVSLGYSLMATVSLILITGTMSYAAYA